MTYFRERGPGSIPGVPRVGEIVRFLQNDTSARHEPRTLRSAEGALINTLDNIHTINCKCLFKDAIHLDGHPL